MPESFDHLRVNRDRLWNSLMAMAEIGATAGGGSHRLALSDQDGEARHLLIGWCGEAGAEVAIDHVGNIFARHPGSDPGLAPVVIGSHLDTQPMGGRFDGVLGVLAALEILRTLREFGVTTRHPIELVDWTNEEGARFAPAMIGSGVFAGLQDEAQALDVRDSENLRFGGELKRIGFAGPGPVGGRPIAAYFELHIEQGPILEAEGLEIGVVTHAQGVRWFDVTIEGAAGHAGTTPMNRRRDALLGAVRAVDLVSDVARAHGPDAVATVGQLSVRPGSRNVIPGSVTLTIDARHPDGTVLARMADELASRIGSVVASPGLTVRVDEVLSFDPTAFDQSCVAAVRSTAEQCGYGHRDMVSGGAHDACNIARIAPATMIFCPCVDGISHSEAEDIRPEWANAGANVVLHAALEKAGIAG